MPEYRGYEIPRTGQAPLQFKGKEEAHSTSHIAAKGSHLRRRWHDLRLFRTEGGKAVVEVQYVTTWQDDPEKGYVWGKACDWNEVPSALGEHDPRDYVVGGFPATERYRDQQEKLLAEICLGYEQAVSALLTEAGFVETVD